MPTIEEQQAQQNINNTFQQQRAARAAQFQSDQNKAQVGASSANTAFQNQDLATRQSILKGNNPAMPTAPTLTTGTAPTPGASVGSPSGVNAPGVIDRNNTVVGGGTVNPIGATGGATPTNGTPTTTSTTPTGTPSATPGILTAEELSPDMQTYLQNNPLAKSQFDLVARQGKEQQAKFLQDAEKAVIESKKQIGYDASQAANAKAQRDLNLQQNFQQGASAINKAEQNMYYSAVSPVTSGSQQTAAHGQIRDMAKQIDAMVIQNGLQNDAYAAQTAENARRIVLDLDNKIGETLNKKLQDIDNGVKNGDIATPEQLDRIFKENSEAILKEVPQLTNFAVQQMSDLTKNFMDTQKELRDNKIKFDENSQKISPVSGISGVATDMNGLPIMGTNGKPIPYPKNAPNPPQYINNNTQVLTSEYDDYGQVQYKIHDVQNPQATAQAQAYVDQGIPYDKIPENLRNTAVQLATQQGVKLGSSTEGYSGINIDVNNMQGADLMAALASGKVNGNKFFGVYATGDPEGKNRANLYNQFKDKSLDQILAQYKGTKITPDMIMSTSMKFNLDPIMVATIMAADSSMGTAGKGARNNNPGNVGQFDSLDAKGITVKGYPTLQAGVDAVGENLRKRMNALASVVPQQTGPKEYSDSQKNFMNGIDVKNPSKIDIAELGHQGLTLQDAYNYKQEKLKDSWTRGLDDTQLKRVNSISDDFYGTPTAKSFNKIQEAYNFASNVKAGDKATDNQALIYAFAKAMDPDSVVREGEYSTVQKYSQTWGDKFKMDVGRVLNGQEFISPTAKKNMVNTIKSKYEASKGQYDQERNTYVKRINDVAGNDIGDRVIPSNATGATGATVNKSDKELWDSL